MGVGHCLLVLAPARQQSAVALRGNPKQSESPDRTLQSSAG